MSYATSTGWRQTRRGVNAEGGGCRPGWEVHSRWRRQLPGYTIGSARRPTTNDSAVHPWRAVRDRRADPHVQAADFPTTAEAITARLQAVAVIWVGELAACAGSIKTELPELGRAAGATLLFDRSMTEWWRLGGCVGRWSLAVCGPTRAQEVRGWSSRAQPRQPRRWAP